MRRYGEMKITKINYINIEDQQTKKVSELKKETKKHKKLRILIYTYRKFFEGIMNIKDIYTFN